MWIRRAEFERLHALVNSAGIELATLRAQATAHAAQAATQQTQTAFLIARINQLEKERAIMLRHITKLEIPVPELVAVPPIDQREILAAMGSGMFEDMGDEAAKREGVQWDASGAVAYGRATHSPKGDPDA